MNKLITFTLISTLFLAACAGPKDTFTVFKIDDCNDYFEYLNSPVESPSDRQGGIVYKLSCVGVMDYQEDARLPYGFLVQTENYGEQRLGLHYLDQENDLGLRTMNGQPITVKGELHIQSADPNGAGLYANEEDVRVIPAF